MNWLFELLGEEVGMEYVISASSFIEQILAAFFFNIFRKKDGRFYFVYLIALLSMPFLALLLASIRHFLAFSDMLTQLIHIIFAMGYQFAIIVLSSDRNIFDRLLDFSLANTTTSVVARLYSITFNFAGMTDNYISIFPNWPKAGQWAFYWIFHIAGYLILAILFNRERGEIYASNKNKRNIVILTLSSSLITTILFSFARGYESESIMLTMFMKIFIILFSIVVMFLSYYIFISGEQERKKDLMDELFRQEKEEFDKVRESMELINQKTHDLRHQLNEFQGRITSEEIETLKKATFIYDQTLHTGYDILDAILYEKMLSCQRKDIRLLIMAEGSALSFMDYTHLYSLLSNLLGNAIEATEGLEKSKRLIDFSLKSKAGFAILEISNYCQGELKQDHDGHLISSKSGYHQRGYGSRSIDYIVSIYDGSIKRDIEEGIFKVSLYFDLEKEAAKAREKATSAN